MTIAIVGPTGQMPLRASFTNPNGGPIGPFAGKPVQRPSGLTKPERLDYIRSRTHVELGLGRRRKNVARQSYTQQLRDSLSYAQSTRRRFELCTPT